SRMRAAATVVRLMPSPKNRITLRALPAMAPLAAAWAAPLRYHHSGVSPSGRVISGTATAVATCGAVLEGAGAVAQAAGSRAQSSARGRARGWRGITDPGGRGLEVAPAGANHHAAMHVGAGRALSATPNVMHMTQRRSSSGIASLRASGYRAASAVP